MLALVLPLLLAPPLKLMRRGNIRFLLLSGNIRYTTASSQHATLYIAPTANLHCYMYLCLDVEHRLTYARIFARAGYIMCIGCISAPACDVNMCPCRSAPRGRG